jgi:XTP/dITP diphosphohydrolase
MRQVVLASANAGKLREFEALFSAYGLQVLSQQALGIAPPEEPFASFLENALQKARHASARSGLAALADDSGICLAALNDQPGVYSARWGVMHHGAQGDLANNYTVNQQLDGRSSEAVYLCCLVFLRRADDPMPLVAQAYWRGRWLAEPRGEGGFGYDPHFLPHGQVLSAAQMDEEEKNRVSHRGRATRLLMSALGEAGFLGLSTDANKATEAREGVCAVRGEAMVDPSGKSQ